MKDERAGEVAGSPGAEEDARRSFGREIDCSAPRWGSEGGHRSRGARRWGPAAPGGTRPPVERRAR